MGDAPTSTPPPVGPARRAASAVGRTARRVFHADGADRSGLAPLSYVTVANFACDAILAVALANTLFFSAATAESRANVALYLLVTVAPFAVVAPVIGPALDRLRSGRRLTVSLTFTLRAVLAVVLALNFDSWLLYPLALGMLVLSKTFGVVKASITPQVLPPALDLVRTNSRLTVLGHVCGSVIAGAAAGLVAWLWNSHAALWLLAAVALVAAYLAMTLPAHAEASPDGESASLTSHSRGVHALTAGLKEILTRPLGRYVLRDLWAVSMVRFMTGFLTLFLAFVAKAQENASAVEQATILAIAGASGGIGTFLGNAVGARLELGRPGRITTTAAGSALAAAIVAAFLGTVWVAAALALIAAVASALGKVALDSSIQTDIPDSARSSAFGRSETALQLAWVGGGALGVLLPPDFTIGFTAISVVGALLFAQSLLTSRGSTLVPGLGGNRPRFPGVLRDPRALRARLLGRMER